MSKRTTFTTITPLPAGVSRQVVLDFLHNHLEMIDLNPLIKERHPISPPDYAPEDEKKCVWYSLTDEIVYMPGIKAAASDVSYTCAFHDLPIGLQTHCYAPMGLDIRDRWSIGGTLPGEPPEPKELGLVVPDRGLYLREDVSMKCNIVMTSFVKKTLKKSHASLVEKLKEKAAAQTENDFIERVNTDRKRAASNLSQGPPPQQQQQQQQPPPWESQQYQAMPPPNHERQASNGSVPHPLHSNPSSSSYRHQHGGQDQHYPASDNQSLTTAPTISDQSTSSTGDPYGPYPQALRINKSPSPANGGLLFDRDPNGEVSWQGLTTKQQQDFHRQQQEQERQRRQRQEEEEEKERRQREQGAFHELPAAEVDATGSQHPHQPGGSSHHHPVEMPAPQYPDGRSYGDLAAKNPYDEATPVTRENPYHGGGGFSVDLPGSRY